MTKAHLNFALGVALVSATYGAFAADSAMTDIGTLAKDTAAKAFPARPYSPYAGRNSPTAWDSFHH